MQLSKYTDYSLRALMYLALTPDKRRSQIRQICEAYGASHNHMVKVVGNLARLGYVQTIRGKSGGIVLARNPLDISVGKVVRESEYTFRAVDCEQPVCPLSGYCSLPGMFQMAVEAYLKVLENYSLQDLLQNPGAMAQTLGLSAVARFPD